MNKIGRIALAAVLFMIIAQVIHTIGAAVSMDYYTDENYFDVWSKIMMPGEGSPPASFYGYSILFGLINGIIFTVVYLIIRDVIINKKHKGIYYGFLVFLVAGTPMSLSLYLLINLPASLIFLWAIEALVIYLAAGYVVARVVKDIRW